MAEAKIDIKEMKRLEYGNAIELKKIGSIDRELAFTELHSKLEDLPAAEREIACLREQTRLILMPIEDGDWFAGRIDRMAVGIDPERGDIVEAAYFCKRGALEQVLETTDDPSVREKAQYLLDYWRDRAVHRFIRNAFPARLSKVIPHDTYYTGVEISYPFFGLGGPCLDFPKLVRKGIKGLRLEIETARTENPAKDEGTAAVYRSFIDSLAIFSDAAIRYSDEAARKAMTCHNQPSAHRYRLIADSCRAIAYEAPRTYHQAMQLVWLYALVSLVKNYGRLDVTLGDFYVHDLATSRLSSEQASELTEGLWRLIVARGDNFNNRILIGGMGRANEKAADQWALHSLDIQAKVNEAIPQLSLRWYEGMDPAIWDKAFDTIAKGSTFPILYNDDINVPAVQRAFSVPFDDAVQYGIYGCGEYAIIGKGINSPNAAINVAKALDVTLFNGVDSFTGRAMGLAQNGFNAYDAFDNVKNAFVAQLRRQVRALTESQAMVYRVTGEHAVFPLLSVLYDDCIARGKGLLGGGVRYLGGALEVFGSNTAADSLYAIKKAVFESKAISYTRLLQALEADFVGFEVEQRILSSAPKFGNDHAEADAMSVWLNSEICRMSQRYARDVGLDTFHVVLVNNGDSVLLGKPTGATADGRRRGQPLSNANQPSAGNDQNGITALLSSMAKLDPSLHAGAVHNVKIARTTMVSRQAAMKALFRAYFRKGGTQAMITVSDRGELERAMRHPEEYRNLIVRVGGYSERFVDLPVEIQKELIRRVLH